MAWLALAAFSGCDRPSRARCELDGETPIARSQGAAFDGIALARHAAGGLAVWSDPSGTWARLLDSRQPSRRVAERCPGGVTLTADGSWLGCSRPDADDMSSSTLVIELASDLGVRNSVELGRAGRDGRAMSLARRGDTLFAAWESGQVGGPSVRLAELELSGGAPRLRSERTLSLPGRNGRQPSLLASGEHVWAVWAESDLEPGGESHRVMIARDDERGRALHQVQLANAAPTLARDDQGLVLAFRDRRRGDARPDLYIARVRDDLTLRDRPRKLGRANSEGGPSLALCSHTRAAAVPIDHAGELYVAFHPLSAALQVLEDNHQFYASGREFVQASTLCTVTGLTALLAERTQPTKPGSELLKVDFHCSQ